MKREQVRAMMPILQAFVDGKEIEGRPKGFSNDFEGWMIIDAISNLDSIEYRIKPEPTYRPFANAEECWNEMQKHQPFGWVSGNNCFYNIVSVSNIDVSMANVSGDIVILNFSDVIEDNTFADGATFGVKVEE